MAVTFRGGPKMIASKVIWALAIVCLGLGGRLPGGRGAFVRFPVTKLFQQRHNAQLGRLALSPSSSLDQFSPVYRQSSVDTRPSDCNYPWVAFFFGSSCFHISLVYKLSCMRLHDDLCAHAGTAHLAAGAPAIQKKSLSAQAQGE